MTASNLFILHRAIPVTSVAGSVRKMEGITVKKKFFIPGNKVVDNLIICVIFLIEQRIKP